MDLKKIKEILENPKLSEELKEVLLLSEVSDDEKTIRYLLKVMEYQRNKKDTLIIELKYHLNKAFIILNSNKPESKIMKNEKAFVISEINKFKLKWNI